MTIGDDEAGIRVTSNNAIGSSRGWYLDLISPGNVFRGEMQVTDSVLRDERIVFTTLIPNADPCGYGGDSYIMIMDALTGGRLNNTFDLTATANSATTTSTMMARTRTPSAACSSRTASRRVPPSSPTA